ncbi:hypothetical protein [Kineosporia sp. NBRC 101731]|uniref:hypothetical protein n=1 Tax=Kineosporia sp. NBRC 101731 TaxID=3032199 RepID=UPI0024A51A1C|nr:hypothetical protein [Kineosporia sp. NBRC 101731]GLY27982.1 hypothetical protein Kisp02_13470 [Kineosporia sp. NBRC 101731]
MSGHIEVAVEDLRSRAREAESAASTVGGLDPGVDLTLAAHEIPGAGSVGALKQVATKWDSDLRLWRDTMRRFGEGLDAAADGYESSDEAGAAAYAALSPEYGLVPDSSAVIDLTGPSVSPSDRSDRSDLSGLDLSVLRRGGGQ